MAISLIESDDARTNQSFKAVMRRYSDLFQSGKYKAEAYINSSSSIITMNKDSSPSTNEKRLIEAISNADKELIFIEDVNRAIAKLDVKLQQVIIFKYVFSYSYTECEKRMTNFRRNYATAKKKLAILLEITVYR